MSEKQIVLLPIEVPNNNYCWDFHNPCEHFDNEERHPKCNLRIGDPQEDVRGYGYEKPKECKKLINLNETMSHPPKGLTKSGLNGWKLAFLTLMEK